MVTLQSLYCAEQQRLVLEEQTLLSVKKGSMLDYADVPSAFPEKMCKFKHKKLDSLYLPQGRI